MRFRWPLVPRHRLDAALAAADILSDEVRDCHDHIAALNAEIARLNTLIEGHWSERFRLAAEVAERDAEIARLCSAPVRAVGEACAFSPPESAIIIVPTVDGVAATIR